MSADLRMMTADRFRAYYRREVDRIIRVYMNNEMPREWFLEAHLNLSATNMAWIQARLKLWSDGYLEHAPF